MQAGPDEVAERANGGHKHGAEKYCAGIVDCAIGDWVISGHQTPNQITKSPDCQFSYHPITYHPITND